MIGIDGAIMIHFEGRDSMGHVIANRSDTNQLMSFARYRSISSRFSSTASKLDANVPMQIDKDRGYPRITDVGSKETKKTSELLRRGSNFPSMKYVTASRKRRLDHIRTPIESKRARSSDKQVFVLRNDVDRGELITQEDPMVDLWSVYNVVDWFQQNGFMEEKDPLIKMFYKRNIDGRNLMRLTSIDLLELGFINDHDRILELIDQFKESNC